MLKKGLIIIGGVVVLGTAIHAVSKPEDDKKVDDVVNTQNITNVYALDLPENIAFAGEKMPMNDPEVLERMDRELLVNTYWQSNMLLLLKRAHKYFPVIEPILKKNGVPDDFKYLAVIESGLQNVVSPAGATGFWQFMKATGKQYGLEVNDNVDERYHVAMATEAACQYLKDAKERLGSWTMAAAAYNAGQAGVQRQLDRQQVTDYYDLLLGEETGRYVFRILAIKEIMSNPKKYGFQYTENHLYNNIPTNLVPVDTAVSNFADFAQEFNINYKILKVHNPWLRDSYLLNKSHKKYFIAIPQEGYYKK